MALFSFLLLLSMRLFLMQKPSLQKHAGKKFLSYLSDSGAIEISTDGWASFTCPYGGLQVWVQEDQVSSQ